MRSACETFVSSTSTPPGFGTTTTSTVRIPPPEEYNLIVDATTGWNGSLAHNPNNNTWLVVSQAGSLTAIFGRVIRNSGAYVTPTQFTLNDRVDGWAGGSPRVAFAASENRYLVVFVRTLANNLNRIYGQFVAADGSLIGSNFVINPEMSGVAFFQDGGGLRYDSKNRKFVLVWEHRSGGIQVYLKTVSIDGIVSAPVQVTNNSTGDYQGAPDVAINQEGGEYCVAYQNYGRTSTGNESQIGIRRVDAGNLSVGSQTFASVRAFGRAHINYNTRDKEYFVTWAGYDEVSILRGRFLGSCSAPLGENSFTIAVDFWDGGVAYNPRSNSFGIVGAMEDVRNKFIALSSDGMKIFESDFFYDANNGNYIPTLAPNLANGSYGLVSSKDYGTFRFAPDAGASVLESP